VPDFKKIIFFMFLALHAFSSYAQDMDHSTEEPTDFMNSNGKIYVVMAVVVIIVLGLFLYLINLDRKIKKLEDREAHKSK
jgi:CcmD family protein